MSCGSSSLPGVATSGHSIVSLSRQIQTSEFCEGVPVGGPVDLLADDFGVGVEILYLAANASLNGEIVLGVVLNR